MQRLAGVFLEVGAGQADELLLLADTDRQSATANHRNLELADLVTLGQVWVKVVLAREDRTRRNLGADGEPELDGTNHCFAVQDRQHTG